MSTLLLVDDEPEILEALRRTLRAEGYPLLTATSGAEALRLLESEPVDLIVSDIDMPGTTGLELIARVRRSHPHVIRVLLTGVGSLESAMQAINEGEVHRFLTKPWDSPELRATLRDVLARFGAPPLDAAVASLAPRVRETLKVLLTGVSEKEIAASLGISPYTVHQYVKVLYRHFAVTSRAELMAKMQNRRLLEPTGRP